MSPPLTRPLSGSAELLCRTSQPLPAAVVPGLVNITPVRINVFCSLQNNQYLRLLITEIWKWHIFGEPGIKGGLEINQEVRALQTAEEVFLWALSGLCGKKLHVASGNRGAPSWLTPGMSNLEHGRAQGRTWNVQKCKTGQAYCVNCFVSRSCSCSNR